MTEAAPALEIRNLSKRFGGELALDGVDLTVTRGEVHGLLGENGSGKSTLIKVLAGYHRPDTGQLAVYGDDVELPLAPGAFRDLGLAFVHQDLALVPELSVVENLFIDEFAQPQRWWHMPLRTMRRKARRIFDRYGVEIDPNALVGELRPVSRALLAIVRAAEGLRATMSERQRGEGILVLDEPTVFLPKTGTEQLFRLVRRVADTGASVIFVSHDLAEVREVTDRLTVLRDGRRVGTVETEQTSEARLVEMIIGRHLEAVDARAGSTAGKAIAAVATSVETATLHDVSLTVHRGEVLGVTGLVGSGYEDLVYVMFGARPARQGTLEMGGLKLDLGTTNPSAALRSGLALIPADRARDGSVASLTLEENLTLRTLDRYWSRMFLHRRAMRRDTAALLEKFDVRPADPGVLYASLSGGNQQKVLMAKWLQTDPDLLLLDEPTQGVDVGARQQILELLRGVAIGGGAVVCASCDYEQLAQLCDRVLVFGRGRIVSELVGDEVTKTRIAEQCYASMGRTADDILEAPVGW